MKVDDSWKERANRWYRFRLDLEHEDSPPWRSRNGVRKDLKKVVEKIKVIKVIEKRERRKEKRVRKVKRVIEKAK